MKRKRTELTIPVMYYAMACVVCLLRNSGIVKEEIAECEDRVNAIAQLVQSENRDLTSDEREELDRLCGKGKKGQAGYVPGVIDKLEEELDRVTKLEKFQQRKVSQSPLGADAAPTEQEMPLVDRVTIPVAGRYRFAPLTAFVQSDSQRQNETAAYIAGRLYAATLFNHGPSQQWLRDAGIRATAQSEGTDGTGGYLVPTEIEQAIIDLQVQYGVFRRNARLVPMMRDTKTVPVRATGISAAWVSENTEISEVNKTWSQASLVAKKMAALIRYSTELNEDAFISLGDDLTREIALGFAYTEDNTAFNGDGQAGATYGGVTGYKSALAAGSKIAAAAGHLKFADLTLADFETVVGALPNYAGISPKWFISKAGWAASMLSLQNAAGGNTTDTLGAGPTGLQFMGYPIEFTEVLPTALDDQSANTILLYFGDPRLASLLGRRRGLTIATSDQRYFEYDQLAIRGTQRLDIKHHSVGTSNTAGAMLGLKTTAAS